MNASILPIQPTPIQNSPLQTPPLQAPPVSYVPNVPSVPQKKRGGCLKYFIIALLGITAFLVFLSIVAYITLLPRIRIGQALYNTISAKSMELNLGIDDFDENIKAIDLKNIRNSSETSSVDLVLTKASSTGDIETVTASTIKTLEYEFLKVNHNKKTQILTQLLTDYPVLSNSKSLESVKPVLFGDYWFREKSLANSVKEPLPPKFVMTGVFTFMTMPFSINSSTSENLNGEEVFVYTLSPRKDIDWNFNMSAGSNNSPADAEEYKDYISDADIEYLMQTLKETKNIEKAKINITISKKDLNLRNASIELPPLGTGTKEVTLENVSTNEITLARFLIQKIINKTHKNNSDISEIVNIEFVQSATDSKIAIPEKIVDLDVLDQETKDLALMISAMFYSDAQLSEKSNTQENLFSTKTHETKLLFDKGEYPAMLKSAEELLSLYSTDKEKAITHYWLGLAHFKLNNIPQAQEALLEATRIESTYAAPYVTLAAIAYSQNDADKGLEYSLKCAELDPQYAWCYNNIGLGYLFKNDYVKGIENLEKAVELDPLTFVFADNLNRAKKILETN